MLITGLTRITSKAQTSPVAIPALGISNPWTDNQLIAPSALAGNFKDVKSKIPVIFNIGSVEDIKGARHIGAVSNAENLGKLRNAVAALPKNTTIVIYCGCCPFSKCPNIRQHSSSCKNWGLPKLSHRIYQLTLRPTGSPKAIR